MINPEIDIKAMMFWNEMSGTDKSNLLAMNEFWGGICSYKYEYIPEDLKCILRRKFEEKGANL